MRDTVYDWSYNLNTFPFSKGNSTNCNAALRSIDKELLEIETALDAFEALVNREKKLLEQGEVQLCPFRHFHCGIPLKNLVESILYPCHVNVIVFGRVH